MFPKITVSTTLNPVLTSEKNFAITAPVVVYVLALLVLTGYRSPQLVLKARSRNSEVSSQERQGECVKDGERMIGSQENMDQ